MRLDATLPCYNELLFQRAFTKMAMSFASLGQKAKVNGKTAAAIVRTGRGHPRNVYKVAKALGFAVKPNDLSAVMKNGAH